MKVGTAIYNNSYDIPVKYRYCHCCSSPLTETTFYRANLYAETNSEFAAIGPAQPARYNFCSEKCQTSFILALE